MKNPKLWSNFKSRLSICQYGKGAFAVQTVLKEMEAEHPVIEEIIAARRRRSVQPTRNSIMFGVAETYNNQSQSRQDSINFDIFKTIKSYGNATARVPTSPMLSYSQIDGMKNTSQ